MRCKPISSVKWRNSFKTVIVILFELHEREVFCKGKINAR